MQQRYDLSEFGPENKEEIYDLSEFGPSEVKKTIGNKEIVKPQQKNLLQEFLKNISSRKNLSLSHLSPEHEEFGEGLKEGFQGSLGAIPGIGKYIPQTYKPQTEEKGLFGSRNLGKIAGAAPIIAGVAMPLASGAVAAGIPAGIAEIGSAGAAGALTTPGDSIERSLGALETALPFGVGKAASKLPGIMNILNKYRSLNPKDLVKNLQNVHDIKTKQASDIYDFIKNEVGPRGVNKIELPEKILSESEGYLPKTRASKKLIEDAKNGDYEALHELQSDLGKRGRKKLSSDLVAENNEGEEILDIRDKILENIKNKFNEYGHKDLSNLLDMAGNQWKQIKDLYYSRPAIAKMVDKDLRLVPKNPLTVFSEESKPMERILHAHPEIAESINVSNQAKKLLKPLKKTAIGTGITIPSLASLQILFGGKNKPDEEVLGGIGESK